MIRKLSLAVASAALLVGCGGGGDINITPTTNDSSVNNSNNTTTTTGGGDNNPCASYVTDGGQTRVGTFDGTNCTYSPTFADSGNNITVDLTIPNLADGGAHIFQGSLFIGQSAENDAELAQLGITQGGDGPTLTIEPGATLAFQSNLNFLVINRGSQIFAVGTPTAPITITSLADVNGDNNTPGKATAEAVSQWGGMVIDGFGVTNACAYTGTRGVDLALTAAGCHVASEGSAGLDENFYGGNNDDDSSGRLEYFIVKHTGAQVANGDELNGITFGAVGRNTIVRNLQVYSTFDDGIEMFGGAVNFENFAAVYVRDDSIDIDEGWIGTISTALVIQSETDGAHCIEADGIGGFGGLADARIEEIIAQGLHSAPTIDNLTCIISPHPEAGATHEPGRGWRLREGIIPTIRDSMVVGAFGEDSADSNYCVRLDNRTAQAATDGDLSVSSLIFACKDKDNGNGEEAFFEAQTAVSFHDFADAETSVDPTAAGATQLQLFEGAPPIFSIDYATMSVNDAAPPGAPNSGDFIGALSQSTTNPFMGWTYGIFDGNRAQPLWFE